MLTENAPQDIHRSEHGIRWIIGIYFVVLSIYAYGNFINEVFPSSAVYISVIRALCDAVFLMMGGKYFFRKENVFLRYFLVFFLIASTVTFKLNASLVDFKSHLNGLREPLMFMVSLAVLSSIFHSPSRLRFIKQMNRFLLIFLIVQIPVSIYQFIQYGAGDQVGGTFSDGGSGMISQIIFIAVYYFLLARAGRFDGIGFSLFKSVPILILLIPVFINETKISFVLIAIMFVLQMHLSIRKMLISISAGLILLFVFFKVMITTTESDLFEFLDPDKLDAYYFSDWADAEDITRFGKIVLTYNLFDEEPYKHIWGAGYGIGKGKYILEASEGGRDVERLYFGSRIQLFSCYIQGGLIFVVILLFINFYYFGRTESSYISYNFSRYKVFVFFVFLLLWVYNDALLVTYFILIVSYFLVFVKYGEVRELRKSILQ